MLHEAMTVVRLLLSPLAVALALGLSAPAQAGEVAAQGQEGTPAQAAAPARAGAPEAPAGEAPTVTPTTFSASAPAADVKRVVFVPETIKAALREEIKKEVLEQAKRENWAAPNTVPDWLRRFELSGDVRGRYEIVDFPEGNGAGEDFPDFHAINTGKPFDYNGVVLANDRWLNVHEDRSRPRLRARLGFDVDLGKGFEAVLRLASGDGTSPVSTNQTLGSSGGFGRYQFWIDRASLRYSASEEDPGAFVVDVGRFENPFYRTELVWDDDVNLDGVAAQARMALGAGLTPFLTVGAFPIHSTALAFPAESPDKFEGHNSWLFAGQLGTGFSLGERVGVKLGAAYFHFEGVEGRKSQTPCDTHLSDASCDGDDTRPLFAQKGNTYMELRVPSPLALSQEAAGLVPRYQYYGLAAEFRELAATGEVALNVGPPLKVTFAGEYVMNLGFSRNDIDPVALNNLDARRCDEAGICVDPYGGGREGYFARVTFGSPAQDRRWSWNASLGYRYLESDAVLDAFTDSDFGLGGTNLEGYVVGAGLAIGDGVWTSARWLSADSVVGAPYAVDVLQVDLSARF